MVCGREWGKSKAQRSNKIGADLKENHIYSPKIFLTFFFLTIGAYLIHLSKSYPYLNTEIK